MSYNISLEDLLRLWDMKNVNCDFPSTLGQVEMSKVKFSMSMITFWELSYLGGCKKEPKMIIFSLKMEV